MHRCSRRPTRIRWHGSRLESDDTVPNSWSRSSLAHIAGDLLSQATVVLHASPPIPRYAVAHAASGRRGLALMTLPAFCCARTPLRGRSARRPLLARVFADWSRWHSGYCARSRCDGDDSRDVRSPRHLSLRDHSSGVSAFDGRESLVCSMQTPRPVERCIEVEQRAAAQAVAVLVPSASWVRCRFDLWYWYE